MIIFIAVCCVVDRVIVRVDAAVCIAVVIVAVVVINVDIRVVVDVQVGDASYVVCILLLWFMCHHQCCMHVPYHYCYHCVCWCNDDCVYVRQRCCCVIHIFICTIIVVGYDGVVVVADVICADTIHYVEYTCDCGCYVGIVGIYDGGVIVVDIWLFCSYRCCFFIGMLLLCLPRVLHIVSCCYGRCVICYAVFLLL